MQESGVTLAWQRCAELPEVMFDGSAVLVGDFVYAGGGSCQRAGSYENECTIFKYDFRNNYWCNLPRTNRHKFAMVCFRDQLVLVGGANPLTNPKNKYLAGLLVWDEQNHCWDEPYTPMNVPRMQSSVIAREPHIVAAGGRNTNLLDSVEVFNGNDYQWQVVEAGRLPAKIYAATSAELAGFWYLIGGSEQKRAVYRASLDSIIGAAVRLKEDEIWERLPDLEFEYATATSFGNCILAIGGLKNLSSSATVFGHFPARKMWLQIERPLPRPFHSSAAVVVPPGELLIIGGCTAMYRYRHVYKAVLKKLNEPQPQGNAVSEL